MYTVCVSCVFWSFEHECCLYKKACFFPQRCGKLEVHRPAAVYDWGPVTIPFQW